MDRLRARHPGVEIESCSGGGGRVDLGMLQRVDEVWTSDNTEALDRLRIQEGFTMAYTPKVMMAWVTDVPNMNGRVTPLRFRFLTAMQGSLGIGGNLDHWSEADGTLATEMVAWYKRVRPSVQEGDLHRLLSPSTDGAAVNEYVGRDGRQVVVFACRQSQQYLRALPTVRLRGLVPDAVYRVERLDDKLVDKAADPLRCRAHGEGPHLRPAGRLRRDLRAAGAGRVAGRPRTRSPRRQWPSSVSRSLVRPGAGLLHWRRRSTLSVSFGARSGAPAPAAGSSLTMAYLPGH